jgi:hypothetical protein
MRRRRLPPEECECHQCKIWRIRVQRWERRARFCREAPPEPYPERKHT